MARSFSRGVRPEWKSTARMPRSARLSTWSFMSEMSGVTTMVTPLEHERGHLKRETLAAPGGEQPEGVVPGQHGIDNLLLHRPERIITPVLFQNLMLHKKY